MDHTATQPHLNSKAARAARATAMLNHFKREQYQRMECAVHILLNQRTTHQLMMACDRYVREGEIETQHALFLQTMHAQTRNALQAHRGDTGDDAWIKSATHAQRADSARALAARWEAEANRWERTGTEHGQRRAHVLRDTAAQLRGTATNIEMDAPGWTAP